LYICFWGGRSKEGGGGGGGGLMVMKTNLLPKGKY